MRVAMVITSYHPIVGGAERQLGQLAPLLQARGIGIDVVTRHHKGLELSETVDGVPVHRLPTPGPKPLAATLFVARAARQILRLKPDIVHAHSLFSPALAAIIAKALGRTPVVAKPMCGGEATRVRSKLLGGARISAFNRLIDGFAVISREIEEELESLGIDRHKRVFAPNGVNVGRFSPLAADRSIALRRQFGLGDGPLVLFAGRITQQKRVPLLLEAWREVRRAVPDASLLLAGANRELVGDALSEDVADAARVGVVRLGHIDDMASLLQAVDIFVLPSATEGLSNALLEAAASAKAIVATRVGGSTDVVQDGESGTLVPVDDRTALSDALIDLCRNPTKRELFGRRARSVVEQRYDIERTADRLASLYHTLLVGEPRPLIERAPFG